MLVLDSNLLIYAYNQGSSKHIAARDWLRETFRTEGSVGIPIYSVMGFLRILTDPRITKANAIPATRAIAIANGWFALPNVFLLLPGRRHLELLSGLALRHGVSGPLFSDAQIAAIALENDGTICSADSDFVTFSEVLFINPLADSVQ